MSSGDRDLLRRYLNQAPDAQQAFAALVEQHLGLVYSVARRIVPSPQLAEEVAQSVFADLARQANRINPETPLVAWLHLVSRRTAVDVVRRESRRQAREEAAALLGNMNSSPPRWSAVAPVLDEAVEALGNSDRTAILLRYFQNKSLREVGAALGTSEDAAQKRVTRAIDQLRAYLAFRGIATTAAVLAADLSVHAGVPVPPSLLTAITTKTGSLVPTVALHVTQTIAMTTFQKSALAAALITAGVVLYEGATIRASSSALSATHDRTIALRAELERTRGGLTVAANRLEAIEREIDLRLARRTTPPAAPDLGMESQIKEWLARIDRLKSWLHENPGFAIPEFELLQDDDWFNVAINHPPGQDFDPRHVSSRLRIRATNLAALQIQTALLNYTNTHEGQLPRTPIDLTLYNAQPIPTAILDRYELLHTGNLSDLPVSEHSRILGSRLIADVERDMAWTIGTLRISANNALALNVTHAQREFRKVYPGQDATSATQLQPYLKWPADVVTVQNQISRPKKTP